MPGNLRSGVVHAGRDEQPPEPVNRLASPA
jgi:hypothetical protein